MDERVEDGDWLPLGRVPHRKGRLCHNRARVYAEVPCLKKHNVILRLRRTQHWQILTHAGAVKMELLTKK
jgi:hypothetical protein